MRVKSQAARSFLSFLKQVDRRLTYLVALLLLVGVPAVLLRGHFRTPAFLFSLKDALVQDSSIRQAIGAARGYSLSYSKQDLQPGDTAHFSVQVMGRCDSAYVLVKGWYSQQGQVLTYQVQDTVFVHSCP
jgi:hypothetical protein